MDQPDNGEKYVRLSCCKSGCTIRERTYRDWNGLCAYQKHTSDCHYCDEHVMHASGMCGNISDDCDKKDYPVDVWRFVDYHQK